MRQVTANLAVGPASRRAGACCTRVLDTLFPPACALCAAPGSALCGACTRDATARLDRCCPRCAMPLPTKAASCGRCLRRAPAFDTTIAAATYEAPFDQLVRSLKYGSALAHAPLFARLLATRVAAVRPDSFDGIDLLLPVPLSRERMAARGFNQSLEIARHLVRCGAPRIDTRSVLRVHDTSPQAALPFDARRRNIRGAFAVVDAERAGLCGRTIGLVDDVMTTGATLDELARTLKRAGCERVVNLVVARTP